MRYWVYHCFSLLWVSFLAVAVGNEDLRGMCFRPDDPYSYVLHSELNDPTDQVGSQLPLPQVASQFKIQSKGEGVEIMVGQQRLKPGHKILVSSVSCNWALQHEDLSVQPLKSLRGGRLALAGVDFTYPKDKGFAVPIFDSCSVTLTRCLSVYFPISGCSVMDQPCRRLWRIYAPKQEMPCCRVHAVESCWRHRLHGFMGGLTLPPGNQTWLENPPPYPHF